MSNDLKNITGRTCARLPVSKTLWTMIEKKAWAGWKLKDDQERKQFRRGVALEECVKKDRTMTEGNMHRLQVSFDITSSQTLQFHKLTKSRL